MSSNCPLHFREIFGILWAVADLDETVAIETLFRAGQVTPKRLFWRGRAIPITAINLVYEGREGTSPLSFFSLQSETATYGVVWNRKNNVWKLLDIQTA